MISKSERKRKFLFCGHYCKGDETGYTSFDASMPQFTSNDVVLTIAEFVKQHNYKEFALGSITEMDPEPVEPEDPNALELEPIEFTIVSSDPADVGFHILRSDKYEDTPLWYVLFLGEPYKPLHPGHEFINGFETAEDALAAWRVARVE